MLKRTPLWTEHTKLGARLVEFGGWEMPVQYTSIVDEHQTVRAAAGIFDISHMGEVFVSGPAALEFLNRTLTNDLRKCPVGRGQYTLMCNEAGGVVDDLYAYRIGELDFLLIVNASRIDDDFAWMELQLRRFPQASAVTLRNASDTYGAVAVQGPRVAEFIDRCFASTTKLPSALQKNDLGAFGFGSGSVWVARTGYTGEDGFEVVAPAEHIQAVWQSVLAVGGSFGLKPCGLGARDTLRTEVCYPLYGHELDAQTTPLEAGLGSFVCLEKGEFVGRVPLSAQKTLGVSRKCVAFRMTSKSAPPRPGYPILAAGSAERVGGVVSGTQSPSLGVGIGLGYVPPNLAAPGTVLDIEIRGKAAPAEVVRKPIYRKAV